MMLWRYYGVSVSDTADTIENVNEGILNPNSVELKPEEMPLMSIADKCAEILHPEAGNTTNTACSTEEAQDDFCSV